MKKKISIITLALLLCGSIIFTSCKKEDPPAAATSIELVSGGSQTGVVENDLDNPIVIVVKDQSGNAFAGAALTFSVTDEGSVSPSSATSDANGNASVTWTLGNTSGSQTLTVLGTVTPLTVNATAGSLAATTIELVSGSDQSEMTEGTLENEIVVVVKDQNGDSFSGATITFDVNEGSVSPITATTDASGNASTSWTLGTTEGTQTLTVSGASTPLTINATGTYRPVVGDFKFGGVIFYVDGTEEHGLVCTISDQSYGSPWGCEGTSIPAAGELGIGDGDENTIAIENECITVGTAADICANLSLNSFEDWFLPSINELVEIYDNQTAIDATITTESGDVFGTKTYWSSSELSSIAAYVFPFAFGVSNNAPKGNTTLNVRAVRSF